MLNYGLGLTRVRFTDYLAASVGMIPGTFLCVCYGKLVGDVARLASGVTRTARRALKEATDASR